MSAAQQDFTSSLFTIEKQDERVPQFEIFLRGRGWLTAAQIEQGLGWHDRLIRALAAASEGRVLSGQKGYKLTRESTPDEANAAADWLCSQADEMRGRAIAIRRVFHAHHLPQKSRA